MPKEYPDLEKFFSNIYHGAGRGISTVLESLERPETGDEALRKWLGTLAAFGGVSGGIALPFLASSALTSPMTIDAKPSDTDVDLIHPEAVRKALESRRRLLEEKNAHVEKSAKVPASTHWPMMGLAAGGGTLLGYELAEGIANVLGEARRKRALSKARRQLQEALLEEQVAALESGGEGPYASAMRKSAQDDDDTGSAFWRMLNVLYGRYIQPGGDYALGGYGMYAAPAALGTYLLSRPHFDRADPERKKFQEAKKELMRRLEKEPPYAQLADIDPKMLERVVKSRR